MRGEERGSSTTSRLSPCYICVSSRVFALEAHAHSCRLLTARAHYVQVLPGYPPLRPGLLTHYIRKTTWAPKEFRRKPHSATTCTDRPSLVPPDEKISDTDLTHMTTTTTTTADESVAPSGYPNTDDSAQRAFLVDGVNQRDLGVGEDVPVGRELAVTLEHEQEQRLGVMAAATAVPAAGNEESEAAATAAAASPQWNVCRLIVQSVTSAVLPVSAAVVPSLRCSHPPPSSSSPRPASSDTVQEVSSASTGAGAGTGAGGGAGAAQHVVLRDEVAEVANAIEDELASRDERDSGLVSETWDGQRPLRERRFQEVQVRRRVWLRM